MKRAQVSMMGQTSRQGRKWCDVGRRRPAQLCLLSDCCDTANDIVLPVGRFEDLNFVPKGSLQRTLDQFGHTARTSRNCLLDIELNTRGQLREHQHSFGCWLYCRSGGTGVSRSG